MKNVLVITDAAPQDKNGYGTNSNMHCRIINSIRKLSVYTMYITNQPIKTTDHVIKVSNSSKIKKASAVIHGYPPYLNSRAIKSIFEVMQEKSISIVYIDNSISGRLIKKIKSRFSGISVVSFFHDIEIVKMKEDKDLSLGRRLILPVFYKNEQLTVDYADKIIVLNERDKKLFEKVYKKIMNNLDLIFSVKEAQKNSQSITPLLSKEAFIREVKMAETLEKDTVSINDFLANPFYGVSKENDLLVFASELLSSIDNETSEGLYRRFKDSKTSDFDKEVLIEAIRTKSIVHKDVELRKMLSDRIIKLVEMQDNIGYLDKYNDKNNERLAYFNLDGLIVSKDELIKILKNENFSTEVGVALSTFYINRAAKIVPCFLRSTFILDKNGVFEKLYKNPNMTFDELGLSKEIVRKNMAEYEALSDLINQRCYKKVRANNGEEIDSCDVEKLKAYERFYKGKYGNFTKDCNNVLATHNYKKFFYKIKDFSLSSLIYTVLTKQKNKVINWGYVCVDDNEDKEKILLGFDVPQLNMTLFSHIKKKYLMEAVKNITGNYVIPVYEGAKDFCVLKNGGRVTTQVLYPITSAERKFLLKSDKTVNTRNTFVKHLKWLQNSKLKPDFVRDPGSRLYDIDKDKIYSNTDNIKIKNQLTQR